MKHRRRWLVVLPMVVLVAGCSTRQVLTSLGIGAAVAGGAAAVYYVKGDLEYDLEHDVNRVYRASLSAMEDRDYPVTKDEVSESSGRIEAAIPAEGGEKKHDLTIKLERKGEYLTHISIRVGTFGDEALSRSILDDIKSRLR